MMTSEANTAKLPAGFPTYREERAELAYTEGSSDKVYNVQLTQAETGWTVSAQWGRRNSTLSAAVKIERVPYDEAKKVFDRLVREKTSKGYREVGRSEVRGQIAEVEPLTSNLSPLTSSRGPVSTAIVFQPELLTRITKEEATRYASNPRYFFQTKQDGDRLTIRKDGADIYGFNKLGQVVRLDPKLHAAIAQLCASFNIDKLLMDGEWESDGFHAWELLECRSDLRPFPYDARLETLETILTDLPAELAAILHLTYTARDTDSKLALLANTKLEGVAVKDRFAPFRPGRNGQHKKFKHEQFASFIVGPKFGPKANDGHRSVALYIFDPTATFTSAWQLADCGIRDLMPHTLRFVSTVKVPDKYELPPIGSVIDVRYLYAYPGGGIAQPSYFGKIRSDVPHRDCSTAQLKFKAGSEEDEA